MTSKQFYEVWGAALASPDRDAYVSDWVLSDIFAEAAPLDKDIDANLITQLGTIWDVAHMSIKDLRTTTGLSQTAFSERFCLPRRTLEDWEGNRRNPPDYIRLMIAQLLGLIQR